MAKKNAAGAVSTAKKRASTSELVRALERGLLPLEKKERKFTLEELDKNGATVNGVDGNPKTFTRTFSVAALGDIVQLKPYSIYTGIYDELKAADNGEMSRDELIALKKDGSGYEVKPKFNTSTKCVVIGHAEKAFTTTGDIAIRYSSNVIVLAKNSEIAKKAIEALVKEKVTSVYKLAD